MMPKIEINYCYGCNVRITCPQNKTYKVIIKDGDEILLTKSTSNSNVIRLGRVYGSDQVYTKTVNSYYRNYSVDVYHEDEIIHSEKIDLTNKNVKIIIESNALGDNIAWIEQVSRFQEITKCNVYLYCYYKDLFEKEYPNLKFSDIQITTEGKWTGLSCFDFECLNDFCGCYYATYNIGFSTVYTLNKHTNPSDPRKITLSKVASDILGIEYKEEKPKISIQNKKSNFSKKYVCIATHSTSLMKYWLNPEGWKKVCDYLSNKGYNVICIDKEHTIDNDGVVMSIPENCVNKTGNLPLQDRITDLLNCEFFIGLGSGLSWLAWALDKKVILVSSFSPPYSEFDTPYRVFNSNFCNSCWIDSELFLLRPEQLQKKRAFCPRDKDFECSKNITPEMVMEKIDIILNESR